jgi:hypothetical protein
MLKRMGEERLKGTEMVSFHGLTLRMIRPYRGALTLPAPP